MSRWDSESTCLLILTRAPIAPHSVGELAQLGERLVCNQEVTGSSPVFSTSLRPLESDARAGYGWASQREAGRKEVLGVGAERERRGVDHAGAREASEGGFFDN